jgi:hypothetical protein
VSTRGNAGRVFDGNHESTHDAARIKTLIDAGQRVIDAASNHRAAEIVGKEL